MNNATSGTALELMKLDLDHKVFEHQSMRVLRMLIPEIANVKGIVGKPMFITVANVLNGEFREVLKRNNKRIIALNDEATDWSKLDKDAYQDKILTHLKIIADLETANGNIRHQIKQTDNAIRLAKMDRMEESELYPRICYVFKIRVALKNIFRDKEKFNWIVREIITDTKELEEYLKKNNINEQENMMTDVTKVLADELAIFKSQIGKLKDFVKHINPDVYEEIEKVDELDLNNLDRVISFVKNFNIFYNGVKTSDEFLKVEGITDELASSITSILALTAIIEPLRAGNIEVTTEMIQNMVNESLKLNAVKIRLSYATVENSINKLFDLGDEVINKEYRDKIITFVLVSVYHLLDINKGSATLNLLTKIHI